MVDPERLHRLLRRISGDLAVLMTYAEVPTAELRGDPVRLGHVKYTFVTMLEGCIDAAQHVCSARGFGPPATNADAVLLLGRHGVLPSGRAEAMAAAVRFRNVLVHLYADVDDDQVVAHLRELADVRGYVSGLLELL